MNRKAPLTEFEQMVLLALLRLGDEAYGVAVREQIENRTGRCPSHASTYAALERLEKRGHIFSWISEAVPIRGGRAKKHFSIEPAGARALHEAKNAIASMWEGLADHPDLNVS